VVLCQQIGHLLHQVILLWFLYLFLFLFLLTSFSIIKFLHEAVESFIGLRSGQIFLVLYRMRLLLLVGDSFSTLPYGFIIALVVSFVSQLLNEFMKIFDAYSLLLIRSPLLLRASGSNIDRFLFGADHARLVLPIPISNCS
jgi:hypothetical protein